MAPESRLRTWFERDVLPRISRGTSPNPGSSAPDGRNKTLTTGRTHVQIPHPSKKPHMTDLIEISSSLVVSAKTLLSGDLKPIYLLLATSVGLSQIRRSALSEQWVKIYEATEIEAEVGYMPLWLDGVDPKTGQAKRTKVELVAEVIEDWDDSHFRATHGAIGVNALTQWMAIMDYGKGEVILNGTTQWKDKLGGDNRINKDEILVTPVWTLTCYNCDGCNGCAKENVLNTSISQRE